MAYKKITGAQSAEIELDGSVHTVNFGHGYKYYAVRNDGSGTIYVSTTDKSCTPKNDGVISIPSGGSYVHYNGYGGNPEIYFSGSGAATVIAQEDGNNPFKLAGKGGGGSVINKYISNGLIYQTSYISSLKTLTNLTTYDYNNYIYFPATIEFCGIYSETSVNGYWFNIQNGYDEIYVGAYQYNSAFRLYLFKTSYGGDITIEPNETATISIVYESKNLISLYKNGMFIKNLNDGLPSISSIDVSKINIMSNFRDGNLNSLRIYNRKLTESEMLHNFSADKALFF